MQKEQIQQANYLEHTEEKINNWFSDTFRNLEIKKLMLLSNTMTSTEKGEFNTLIGGDEDAINKMIMDRVLKKNIIEMIICFLSDLLSRTNEKIPNVIGFDLSSHKIYVWAEINDGDEEIETALILAEAKANTEFYEKGLYMTSTILEASDKIEIPSQYSKLIRE